MWQVDLVQAVRGGACRPRAHLAHTPGTGVTACTGWLPAVTAFFQKSQASKVADKHKRSIGAGRLLINEQ